jgi:hypothetical protein
MWVVEDVVKIIVAIATVVGSSAAVFASITAWKGINTWRREFLWKKRFEVAEEVMTLMYDCQFRLQTIRNPSFNEEEISSRKPAEWETESDKRCLNAVYVVFERFNEHRETFSKLFASRYRFMALFGKDAAQPIEDFRDKVNNVLWEAETHPLYCNAQVYWNAQGQEFANKDEINIHRKEMREHLSILSGTFSEQDKFNTKIEEIVSRMDANCARVLRPKPL